MKKIFSMAVAMCAFLGGMAPAFADQRTSLIVTSPLPLSTATVNTAGVGLGYDLIKLNKLSLTPFVSVDNIKDAAHSSGALHVLPGLALNLNLGKFSVGVGEVLRPNAKVNLSATSYTPTLELGYKL